jgi:hypothetical protein
VGQVAQEPGFRRVTFGFPLIIIIRPLLLGLTLGFISGPALDWWQSDGISLYYDNTIGSDLTESAAR